MTKQEIVYNVLRTNRDKSMTARDINRALSTSWLDKTVHRAVYRNLIKGLSVQIIKIRKGTFEYRYNTPIVTTATDTKEDPLDASLARIRSITAPAKVVEEPDLFNNEDYTSPGIPVYSETTEKFPEIYPMGNPCVQTTIPEEHTIIAPSTPNINEDALVHLIYAFDPVPVTPLNIAAHFGCDHQQAVRLLMKLMKVRGINLNVTATVAIADAP